MLDSAREAIFILVSLCAQLSQLRSLLRTGLVVDAGTLPPPAACIQRGMAAGSRLEEESRTRCQNIRDSVQRSDPDHVYELEPHEARTRGATREYRVYEAS